jgi:hypothetical protein
VYIVHVYTKGTHVSYYSICIYERHVCKLQYTKYAQHKYTKQKQSNATSHMMANITSIKQMMPGKSLLSSTLSSIYLSFLFNKHVRMKMNIISFLHCGTGIKMRILPFKCFVLMRILLEQYIIHQQ